MRIFNLMVLITFLHLTTSSCNKRSDYIPDAASVKPDYTISVNGKSAIVNTAKVCLLNDVNTPLITTEAYFTSFEILNEATVVIHSKSRISNAIVRPLSTGIVATISPDGFEATMNVTKPQNLMVEFNGITDLSGYNGQLDRPYAPPYPVFLFANPPETDVPLPDQAGIRYFGPGVHDIGHCEIKSNETFYFAEGSIVSGTLYANGADNIKITGRGILDGSKTPDKAYLEVDLFNCKNVVIDGIIARYSSHWTFVLTRCQNVVINNIKVINWDVNRDGIDICNSKDVTVTNCFLYTADDCISPKGCVWWHQDVEDFDVKNINISDCFFINTRAGHAIRVGDETVAPYLRDITVKNSDVYNCSAVFGISNVDRGMIRNLTFEDIRVERYSGYTIDMWIDGNGEFSADRLQGLLGDTDSVLFKNIDIQTYYGGGAGTISGYDANHMVRNVTFENVKVAGVKQSGINTNPGGIYPYGLNDAQSFRENLIFK
jgi:hypothetical protein